MLKSPPENDTPFFVIGSPRSGTTLLRLVLSRHSGLIVPPECGFLLWLQDRFYDWSANDSESSAKRQEFAQAVTSSRKFETWDIANFEIVAAILRFRPESYSELCACVYRIFSEKSGKLGARWGDKNNYYLSSIDELEKLYPKAKFIHIVRDGRDVACSYREVMSMPIQSQYQPSLPTDIEEIAQVWSNDIKRVREQLSLLKIAQSIEVRYEDLTGNTEFELTRICEFLGCDFENAMLSFHRPDEGVQTEPLATIGWKKRTVDPISSATVGRYSHVLTGQDISVFESVAHHELELYDYDVLLA